MNKRESRPLVMAFLKAPRPSLVKTRLAEKLGAERATDVYRGLVERQLRAIPAGWAVEIHFSPADAEPELRAWLGEEYAYRCQSDGDPGHRLRKAFGAAFARRNSLVLAISGDCPDLDQSTFLEAAGRLSRADVVLGPARNGSYYLLGLRAAATSLFDDIPWNSSKILTATLARAKAAGLSRELLPPKDDIDDLPGYKRYLERVAHETSGDRLAVVITTLNEGKAIGVTVSAVRRAFPTVPILVVDGRSTDRTREIAAANGAKVIPAPRGRGAQCRIGASAAADADWLLFLRGDTQLPDDADVAVAELMGRLHAQIATFRVGFDEPGAFLRACGWCSRFDSVFTRFSDQGLLVRREFYDALGGFPAWPIFEEVAFLQRARRVTRIHSMRATVTTSARRFQQMGAVRQQWLNARLLARYLCGATPATLAAEYEAAPARRAERNAGGIRTASEPSP
jgi:uncharacterized protein